MTCKKGHLDATQVAAEGGQAGGEALLIAQVRQHLPPQHSGRS